MGRYAAAAEVLRALAVSEPAALDGVSEPLRRILRTGAEACERLDEVDQKYERVLSRIAELETLLHRAAEALSAEPLPIDGGSWVVFTIAAELRRALGQDDQS